MKDMTNRRATSATMLLITVVISGMNLYLLCGALTRLVLDIAGEHDLAAHQRGGDQVGVERSRRR